MSSSGFQATKLSDSTDLRFIVLCFKLALNPLLLIHIVTHHWLYSVLLGFQRWQRHTFLQFLACVIAGANCKCVWLYAVGSTLNSISLHSIKSTGLSGSFTLTSDITTPSVSSNRFIDSSGKLLNLLVGIIAKHWNLLPFS
jgi:hypothetical protein